MQRIAIGGCMTFGFVLLALLHISVRGPHFFVIRFLTDVPYSPAFWGSAFVAGFARSRHVKDRLALWLGPIALVGYALLILGSVPGYLQSPYELAESNHSFVRYIWDQLLSIDPNKCVGGECLGKLMFTAPVLSCIAYSLG